MPSLPRAKAAVAAFYTDGRYDKSVAQTMAEAAAFIEAAAKDGKKLAVVLDIDDTALSTYEYQSGMGFGHNGKLWHQWIDMKRGKAIAPVRDFCIKAANLKIAIFFVSGRREAQRKATEANLQKEGFPAWAGIMMKPDDFKSPSVVTLKSGHRREIEKQGYEIIANIGDQPSDIEGGHSGRPFLLPNLIYEVK